MNKGCESAIKKIHESRIPVELYHGPMKGNENAHAAVCTLQSKKASQKITMK